MVHTMIYPEDDAPLLKAWIVKRLDNDSDADPDILAEYVLALLRHDGDEQAVRELCMEEIPDFLRSKEGSAANPAAFVNDIFDCIHYKAYLPGRSLSKMRGAQKDKDDSQHQHTRPQVPHGRASILSAPPPVIGQANHTHEAQASVVASAQNIAAAPMMNSSRKRLHHDKLESDTQTESLDKRPPKQTRRGGAATAAFAGPFAGPFVGPNSLRRPHPAQQQQDNMAFLLSPVATGPMSIHNKALPDGMSQPHPALPMSPIGYQDPGYIYPQSHPAPYGPPQYMGAQNAVPGGYPAPPRHHDANQRPKQASRMRCIAWDTSGFCSRGSACKFAHILATPVPSIYDLQQSSSDLAAPPSSLPQLGHFHVDGLPLPQMEASMLSSPMRARSNRTGFPTEGMPVYDRTNTTIVVENVPDDSFNDSAVDTFFAQFGSIAKLTLSDGPKNVAIIKYDKRTSALNAYKSPKVIFDNRFVKVYWHKDASSTAGISATPSGDQPSEKQTQGSFPAEIDMEEFLEKQIEAQKHFEERAKKKQQIQEQREQVERRQKEIEVEKRTIIDECAARGIDIKPEYDEEDDDDGIVISTGDKIYQSKPTQMSKEALEAKLAEIQEEARTYGIDPDDDMDSVAGWAAPSHRGALFRGRGRGRGSFRARFGPRGGYRGGSRGRGGYRGGRAGFFSSVSASIHEAYARYSLDNRPKTVHLSGVDFTAAQEYEALRHHLLGIGEFAKIDNAPEGTSVAFKDRKTAEGFYNSVHSGQVPGVEGNVEVSWVANTSASIKTEMGGESSAHSKAESTTKPTGSGIEGGDQKQQQTSASGLLDVMMAGTAMKEEGEVLETTTENAHVDYDVADDNDWDVA